VPPSYAGLENPFSWDDVSAQEQGEGIYQRLCLSCHSTAGDGISEADFSTLDYANALENNPDYYFWKLSEGELDYGMPAYKSTLTEEQMWHVLTYSWDLGRAIPPETTPPTVKTPIEAGGLTLLLVTADQAKSGQPIFLTTVLRDGQGKPIPSVGIKFFIKVGFFINDLIEIGEVLTNNEGSAIFEYIPRQAGEIEVLARYETIEATKTVILTMAGKPFYQPEVGLEAWAPGEEEFINLPILGESEDSSSAPKLALRLPTGVLLWGTPLLLTVIAIWVTCFYVGYQLIRIPVTQEIRDINTKLVPKIILAIIMTLGILLTLMLITGPYSS
jgi:hypothetical protein